jgi:hypothetical protein
MLNKWIRLAFQADSDYDNQDGQNGENWNKIIQTPQAQIYFQRGEG